MESSYGIRIDENVQYITGGVELGNSVDVGLHQLLNLVLETLFCILVMVCIIVLLIIINTIMSN